MSFWDSIKHFKASEFDSRDAPGSGAIYMREQFVRQLDLARELCGFPWIVLSGYRTDRRNEIVGGALSSGHEDGWCADIRALSPVTRDKILDAARIVGIRQKAIGDVSIHLGSEPGKRIGTWIYHPGDSAHWF